MIAVEVGTAGRFMDFPSVTRHNWHVCLATVYSYPTRNNRAHISADENNAALGLEIIKLVDLS